MSNYPLGAKYDKRAPYNKEIETKKVSVCVSVTYHTDIEVEVECPYDEVDLNYAVIEATYDMHSHMDKLGWHEDEFEVIEE